MDTLPGLGDPADALVVLLGEEAEAQVAQPFVVVHRGMDRVRRPRSGGSPFRHHARPGVLDGGVQQSVPAAEVAQDGLDGHAGEGGDIVEGDRRDGTRPGHLDQCAEDGLPSGGRGRGPGGHLVAARHAPTVGLPLIGVNND